MKTSVLNIKIDPEVKNEAQKVADEFGFSLSAIINASLKDLVRSKTISYSLLEPTQLLEKSIRSARIDRTKRKQVTFSTAPDFMKSLRS
ncbi:MAG: type II toxin-antitoxin system RelB/DinJ family antitoxin [Candidatus Staskawiczbacteria bacterium]|nr:type II toxin-antitoxin system RelB/DinJ family antitoxin [Candidatus Staskawiczbacteria bacterium]